MFVPVAFSVALLPALVCLTLFVVESGVNSSVMLQFGVLSILMVRKSSWALLTQPAQCCLLENALGVQGVRGVPTVGAGRNEQCPVTDK